MSQKTNPNGAPPGTAEFSKGFLAFLVLLAAAVLVTTAIKVEKWDYERLALGGAYDVVLVPWVLAGRLTIQAGITEFGGKTPMVASSGHQLVAVLGLLCFLIIGPTLFLFGLRQRAIESGKILPAHSWRASTIIFNLGLVLVLVMAIPIGPFAAVEYMAERNLRSAQAIQENRDYMINEINFIAFDLTQYRLLPARLQGGNGSFVRYSPPDKLFKTPNARFEILQLQPNVLELEGTSALFPSCKIGVKIDSSGRCGWWTYYGEFQ